MRMSTWMRRECVGIAGMLVILMMGPLHRLWKRPDFKQEILELLQSLVSMPLDAFTSKLIPCSIHRAFPSGPPRTSGPRISTSSRSPEPSPTPFSLSATILPAAQRHRPCLPC